MSSLAWKVWLAYQNDSINWLMNNVRGMQRL